MEIIEQLPSTDVDDRWLVRTAGGELRVACMQSDWDQQRLAQIERVTARWLGVKHPRMATVHERVELAGRVAYIVDDDRGPSLADAAATLADSPVDRERWAVAQLVTIADVLATLGQHMPGFIHGDLDASKLFVDPTGRARMRAPIGLAANEPLIDRSNRTGAGVVMGTPHFMSPEQARGVRLTAASDVFALGANLAYALAGVQPFEREGDDGNLMTVLMRILMEPPNPVRTYAPGLDEILARALAKKSEDRFPTPAAFGAALYECVPDAGDYDAVISDRLAAWWPTATPTHDHGLRVMNLTCKKRWDELAPAADDSVRHCHECRQPVVQIRSTMEAIPLVGQCMSLRT